MSSFVHEEVEFDFLQSPWSEASVETVDDEFAWKGSTKPYSSSSNSRLQAYGYFSHKFFQVISSFRSSRHRFDTCEALARVFGSSTKERT
jgi:hypothetical protein